MHYFTILFSLYMVKKYNATINPQKHFNMNILQNHQNLKINPNENT